MTQLIPNGKQQFTDLIGRPLLGGKVYFYSVGTQVYKNTYKDAASTVLNTNPVILDARGSASIYGSGSYRQVLRDAFGSLIWDQVITDPVMDLQEKLNGPDAAKEIGYRYPTAGSSQRTVEQKLSDMVSAMDYGATGDGVTDDSLAVQSLIDVLSAQGGGCIYFPRGRYRLNITLRKNVSLVGASWGASRGLGVSGGTVTRWVTTFIAAGAGWIVDTVAETSYGIGINGIDFQGLGASVVGGGVNIRAGNNAAIIRACIFNNFADEALVSNALIGRFSDLASTNCLLRRVRTERTGTFRISGADNFIERVQGNAGITALQSSDMFLCAIYIGGANNYALHLEGELSEIGIFTVVSGATHKIVNSRADLNYGHGFVGGSMFSNCHALNNSNGAPGVYSGFVPAVNTQYSGCRAVGAHKYGVDADGIDFSAVGQRPNMDNFVSTGHVTAAINYPGSNGVVIGMRGAHLRNVSAGGEISVSGGINSIRFNHSSSTDITNLGDGHLGQFVVMSAGTANSVLVSSAAFIVNGVGSDGRKAMRAGRLYLFQLGQAGWVEITDINELQQVTTANRPTAGLRAGMMLLDSTLGRPIFRNSANSAWNDFSGNIV